MYAKEIFLSLISILFTLVLTEVVLRVTGFFEPIRVLCYHLIMKTVYCNNTEGYLVHDIVKSYVKVNSDGLLDKEYTKKKPPGILRVAVIGDSFAASEYVGHEKSFHGIWEESIPTLINIPVEVINFAVDGYGTWQQLQTFHLKAKNYKPDVTILAFYWGNDIYNNIEDFKDGGPNPLLDEYPVGSPLLKLQAIRKNFNRWLWNHFSTYQFLRKRSNIIQLKIKHILWPEIVKILRKFKSKTEIPYYMMDRKIDQRRDEDQKNLINIPVSSWEHVLSMDSEGWILTKKLILKLRDEVEASGSKFLLIHFGALGEYKDPFLLPVREFDSFLKEQNIAHVNLFDEFQKIEYESLKDCFIPEDIHFNEKGHQKFANMSIDFVINTIKKTELFIQLTRPANPKN